jgi:transmembrane sensor
MENNQDKVTELLESESFLAWHFKTNEADIAAWDNRLKANPELKTIVDKAVKLLNALQIKEDEISPKKIAAAEKRLLLTMGPPLRTQNTKVVKMFGKQAWRWVAASVILVVCISLLAISMLKSSINTTYAQIKDQQLPDGSQVILNANSKLTYSKEWNENISKDREVWIKGEAYFHVKKTAAKTRFIVHTTQFDIVVTGTQFNVNNRDEAHPKVVLREGSITIKRKGAEDVFIKPGESFEVADNCVPVKKTTNTEVPLAWIDKKLNFDNTPMGEVRKTLQAIYGIEVVFADAAITNETITGIMPNDNLEVFIESLQATMAYKVERKDNVLTISKIH